jgi:hypothetical protein
MPGSPLKSDFLADLMRVFPNLMDLIAVSLGQGSSFYCFLNGILNPENIKIQQSTSYIGIIKIMDLKTITSDILIIHLTVYTGNSSFPDLLNLISQKEIHRWFHTQREVME